MEVMGADYDMQLSPRVLILIKKICRGLRVLEHVTAYNPGNQKLIIQHKGMLTAADVIICKVSAYVCVCTLPR